MVQEFRLLFVNVFQRMNVFVGKKKKKMQSSFAFSMLTGNSTGLLNSFLHFLNGIKLLRMGQTFG